IPSAPIRFAVSGCGSVFHVPDASQNSLRPPLRRSAQPQEARPGSMARILIASSFRPARQPGPVGDAMWGSSGGTPWPSRTGSGYSSAVLKLWAMLTEVLGAGYECEVERGVVDGVPILVVDDISRWNGAPVSLFPNQMGAWLPLARLRYLHPHTRLAVLV